MTEADTSTAPYVPGGEECAGKLPGHAHCPHGHVRDCPVPGDCVYTWPDGKVVDGRKG